MQSANYDLKCLMCSADVGQILGHTFVPGPDHRGPVPDRLSTLRCGHCGGSLLFEPSDALPSYAALADSVEPRTLRRAAGA